MDDNDIEPYTFYKISFDKTILQKHTSKDLTDRLARLVVSEGAAPLGADLDKGLLYLKAAPDAVLPLSIKFTQDNLLSSCRIQEVVGINIYRVLFEAASSPDQKKLVSCRDRIIVRILTPSKTHRFVTDVRTFSRNPGQDNSTLPLYNTNQPTLT